MRMNNILRKNKPIFQILNKDEYDKINVGLMFPISIGVGLGIGYILDKILKTSPYLLIIFLIYGILAGFVNLFKVANKSGKKDQ